jgi:hypothetical protein
VNQLTLRFLKFESQEKVVTGESWRTSSIFSEHRPHE